MSCNDNLIVLGKVGQDHIFPKRSDALYGVFERLGKGQQFGIYCGIARVGKRGALVVSV